MDVIQALQTRKSTRAFLDKPVPPELIHQILEAARHAPSGANIQPWQVAVVSGEKKIQLQQKLENAFQRGEKAQMDYQYYPLQWSQPYKNRRVATGVQLYSALGIQRDDKQRRLTQWAANYRAFDAPVVMYILMDGIMEAGGFVDCGLFLQSLMLAAVHAGLATCPQAALAEYPALVKSELGYPDSAILVCGVALGYEDKNAAVNSYRTPREEVSSFTRFFS